jgi:predicted TIM-barrel fold metal-dependent hydrolase
MDYCGIDEALVFHSTMKYGSPVVGNRAVWEETKKHGRIHATWAILPPQTGEQPGTEEFMKLLHEHNIKALYAFPDEHGYMLNEVVFGDLLDELTHRAVPLLFKPHWQEIYSLLQRFPKLTLIAVGQGPHGADRLFRPLIERYDNFYIDTSGYLQDGGIEAFCNTYGAHRMLFSTGYPGNCIGGPLLRILTADISDADRELICDRNIRRILGDVKL